MPRTRAPYPVELGASDLGGRPRRCPRRQQRPLGRDLGVSFDERPDHTPLVWAWPAAFLPPQPDGPAKRREVHQPDRPLAFGPQHPTTGFTYRPGQPAAYHHPQPLISVFDPYQIHFIWGVFTLLRCHVYNIDNTSYEWVMDWHRRMSGWKHWLYFLLPFVNQRSAALAETCVSRP